MNTIEYVINDTISPLEDKLIKENIELKNEIKFLENEKRHIDEKYQLVKDHATYLQKTITKLYSN